MAMTLIYKCFIFCEND